MAMKLPTEERLSFRNTRWSVRPFLRVSNSCCGCAAHFEELRGVRVPLHKVIQEGAGAGHERRAECVPRKVFWYRSDRKSSADDRASGPSMNGFPSTPASS